MCVRARDKVIKCESVKGVCMGSVFCSILIAVVAPSHKLCLP